MARRQKPLPAGILRDESIHVRMTEEERTCLARLTDFRNLSTGEVVRALIMREWRALRDRVLAVERARTR